MLQYGIQGGRWDIYARLAGHRDRAWLARVFVLPVATAGSCQPPAIVLKEPDQLADLHALPVSLPLPCNVGVERRRLAADVVAPT